MRAWNFVNRLTVLLLVVLLGFGGWGLAASGEEPVSGQEAGRDLPGPGEICAEQRVLFALEASRLKPPTLVRQPSGEYWVVLTERFLPGSRRRSPGGDIGVAQACRVVRGLVDKAVGIDLLGDLTECVYGISPVWSEDGLATGWVCRPPADSAELSGIRSFLVTSRSGGTLSAARLCEAEQPSCALHALAPIPGGGLWTVWSDEETALWAQPSASDSGEEHFQDHPRWALGTAVSPWEDRSRAQAVTVGGDLLVAHSEPEGRGLQSILFHHLSPDGPVREPLAVSGEARAAQGWVDLALHPDGSTAALAWLWERGLSGGAPEAFVRTVSLEEAEPFAPEISLLDSLPSGAGIGAVQLAPFEDGFLVGWVERGRGQASLWVQKLDPRRGLMGQPWLVSEAIKAGTRNSFKAHESQSMWLFEGEVLWRSGSESQRGFDEIRRCVIDPRKLDMAEEEKSSNRLRDKHPQN